MGAKDKMTTRPSSRPVEYKGNIELTNTIQLSLADRLRFLFSNSIFIESVIAVQHRPGNYEGKLNLMLKPPAFERWLIARQADIRERLEKWGWIAKKPKKEEKTEDA